MKPIVRNILAVAAGVIAGGAVNLGLVMVSGSVIPPPEGVDVMNAESIAANIDLFRPEHFVFPFLAHALGTFIGAFVAAFIAVSHQMTFAMVIGVLTLIGGIAAALMIPAPAWFVVLDLLLAYIPMAWLGGRLGAGKPVSA